LRLVNAGHEPAFYIDRNGRCTELAATAPPLGISADIEFSQTELQLAGGHLFVYTDGLSEFQSEDKKSPNHDKLKRMLSQLSTTEPTRPLDLLLREIDASSRLPHDDLTVLVINASQGISGMSDDPGKNAVPQPNLR